MAPLIASGVFLDAPVQGLGYASGGVNGLTGPDGKFSYTTGDTVRFFIGGIGLGYAPGAALITPVDLTPAGGSAAAGAINRTRFLLTLDDDGNPDNGIQITANERALATATRIDFDETIAAFDGDGGVQSMVAQLTAATSAGARSLVSADAAQVHLAGTMGRYYAGRYGGTFTGIGGSGTLTVTLAADGTVSGTAHFDQGGDQPLAGQFTPDGALTFQTPGAETVFNGSLSPARAFSGVWDDRGTGVTGSFSGGFEQPVNIPNTYTVGGAVNGLNGTLTLQDNGVDLLAVHGDGTFTFPAPLNDGAAYSVNVAAQPAGQTCTVDQGDGTVQGADVTTVTVACSDNPPSRYSVGGDVSGLSGSLVLQINGGGQLTVTQDGAFSFPTTLADGSTYTATVAAAPPGETCNLANGSGTVQGGPVTSITVTCQAVVIPAYPVGGQAGGLSGALVLQINGGEQLSVAQDGAFAFPTPLPEGTNYTITVLAPPAGQTCDVADGSGTVRGGPVTSVTVTCQTVVIPTYTVGGEVSGLSGPVVLQLNGGETLSVASDGPFTFSSALHAGDVYTVTVASQPTGQSCTLSGDSGTVQAADVTDVAVSCQTVAPPSYYLGGTVTGLAGVVTLENAGQTLTVTADGPFSFGTPLVDGSAYDVQIATQPAGQTCTVSDGSGVIQGADVATVAVDCGYNGGVPTPRIIGGTVTGLTGGTLVLANGGEQLAIFQDGPFQFDTPVLDGAGYSVSVVSAPAGQSCTVANGTGTVAGSNVSVTVTCQAALFTIGGSVVGLDGTLVLTDNGGDTLSLTADGPFTFPTALPAGTAYSVSVESQPDRQVCQVSDDSGVVTAADVTSVSVQCDGAVPPEGHGHGHGRHGD